jgi:PIN domain nuclease of toxin-antitoxin system
MTDLATQRLLLDTHVWFWVLTGNRQRLSAASVRWLEQEAKRARLLVSVISVWELCLLEAKGRVGLALPRAGACSTRVRDCGYQSAHRARQHASAGRVSSRSRRPLSRRDCAVTPRLSGHAGRTDPVVRRRRTPGGESGLRPVARYGATPRFRPPPSAPLRAGGSG